jgi:outer membrane protein assembly factor BamB
MYLPFLDLDGDGRLDAAEWKTYQNTMQATNSIMALRPGGKGDVTDTAVRWKYFKSVPQCPSPLLFDELIYMLRDNGALSVLDAGNGSLVRESRVRGVAEPYFASPVAAGGAIWFASHKGVVTALAPGREERVMGVTDLGEEITATPAFAPGRVVVRTSQAVYCFGKRP